MTDLDQAANLLFEWVEPQDLNESAQLETLVKNIHKAAIEKAIEVVRHSDATTKSQSLKVLEDYLKESWPNF